MARVKDLSPSMHIQSSETELSLPFGTSEMASNSGGLTTFSNSFKRGYGDKVYGVDERGLWLGNADFTGAPFRVDYDGHVVAVSADFSAAGYSKLVIFKQDAIPTSISIGDLWFDTNDSNKLYRAGSAGAVTIASGKWELVRDTDIAQALQDASDAQNTADSKVNTFLQTSIPTSISIGDIWIDTDDSNKMYRAASIGATTIATGQWVAVSTIGITIFAQDGIPTSTAIGDLWYDTDDSNKQYRAASVGADAITAGEWVLVSTMGITIFAQDAIPTSVTIGDLWYDTNDNNRPYRAYAVGAMTIASGQWQLVEDQRAADALLKAGTGQTLSGDFAVGSASVKIDGVNGRIFTNDGTNNRCLLGGA